MVSDGDFAYEMQTPLVSAATRQRSASGNRTDLVSKSSFNAESGLSRRNTTGRRVGEGLKKRFGSLRKNKKTTDDI